MNMSNADALVKVWEALTREEQLEFVLRFESDIRNALVYGGTLEPPVTPDLSSY